MIKKRMMEDEHEQKKLNPNSHYYSEIKNKKNENSQKSTTIQFYIAIILLLFLTCYFCFPSSQKNTIEGAKIEYSSSKSKKFKLILLKKRFKKI